MSDRTCPLGDDRDLTVAYMAGAEAQRAHMHRRIEEAAARIEELERAGALALQAITQLGEERDRLAALLKEAALHIRLARAAMHEDAGPLALVDADMVLDAFLARLPEDD